LLASCPSPVFFAFLFGWWRAGDSACHRRVEQQADEEEHTDETNDHGNEPTPGILIRGGKAQQQGFPEGVHGHLSLPLSALTSISSLMPFSSSLAIATTRSSTNFAGSTLLGFLSSDARCKPWAIPSRRCDPSSPKT